MSRGRLSGRVAIVTGAAHGLGRAHALYMAGQGARIVVNDLGGSVHGEGRDSGPAEGVAEEIRARGGEAIASGHDVADWHQAQELVRVAIGAFGALHVLVNNAGIVRDRTLANMSEAEWDDVIRLHLKGHAAPTRHAMAYWRDQHKQGHPVKASIVHTSSVSGLAGIFGQANYGAAKLGIVALSRVAMLEGARYGVRSNVISPSARTRITTSMDGSQESLLPPEVDGVFDSSDPANVSPLVGWLGEENCPATGQIFHIGGNRLLSIKLTEIVREFRVAGRWTADDLDRELSGNMAEPPSIEAFLGRPTLGQRLEELYGDARGAGQTTPHGRDGR